MGVRHFSRLLLLGSVMGALWGLVPAEAGGFKSPEECLAYAGEAHLNCLYAYIEIQQGQISQLQEELRTQKATAGQLQEQVNRQASVTEHLQQRIRDRDQTISDFQRPWIGLSYSYGIPFSYSYGHPFFYGRRFFGPCYSLFYSYPCW
jgi:hypothetical protein